MVHLEDTLTREDLYEWYRLQKELARIKASESLLRKKIARHTFPEPVEGTNTSEPLDDSGAVIKMTHVINRKVIPTEFFELQEKINTEGSNLPKIDLDELVVFKPELVIKAYRTLTEEERHVFDQCLEIKDGSPGMEIVIPKR